MDGFSDREVNEAQGYEYLPRQMHENGSFVQCTFMKIPQVKETFAVFLSRPWWMFGAEMGVNEFGVCIGNEAVFTTRIAPSVKRNEEVLIGNFVK